MLTRDKRCVRLLMVLLTVLLCQNASAVTVIFEAEDANNDENPGTFYNVIPGYSGTGYMLLDGAFGTGLDFTVNVRDAGDYPLTLRYHSPFGDKIQEIWVNDIKVDQHNFTQTTTWSDYVYGDVSLNAGDNIIRIQINWSWVYHDYIAVDGFPSTATDPIPELHATVSTDLTQLCWTNPDPGAGDTITCDVYFGTTEPNNLLPGYGLTQIAAGTSETCVDIPSALESFNTYYWVVDCWDSEGGSPVLLPGYFWDFNTNNTVPDPNAGPDQYVGFGNAGDPNSANTTLDATTSRDDGLPSGTLNYIWEQVSGPAGVIVNPYDTAVTTVNLSGLGTYEFRVTVDDTDLSATDTVLVNVYESTCEALKAQPGGIELDPGDVTEDCFVGIEDAIAFAWHWLECNSLAPCN